MPIGDGRSKGYLDKERRRWSGTKDNTLFSLLIPIVGLPTSFMLKVGARAPARCLLSPIMFVYVMAHEIGHNLGMTHDHTAGCDKV